MLETIESTETYGIIELAAVPFEKPSIFGHDLYDQRAMKYLSDAVAGFLDSPVAMLNGKMLEAKSYKVDDIIEFKESLAGREIYLYDVRYYANSPIYGNYHTGVDGVVESEDIAPTISADRGYWNIRYAEVASTTLPKNKTNITSNIDEWLISLRRKKSKITDIDLHASEYVAHKLKCDGYALFDNIELDGKEFVTTNRAAGDIDALITGFGDTAVYLHSVSYIPLEPHYRNACPVTGDISYADTLILPKHKWSIRYVNKVDNVCKVRQR